MGLPKIGGYNISLPWIKRIKCNQPRIQTIKIFYFYFIIIISIVIDKYSIRKKNHKITKSINQYRCNFFNKKNLVFLYGIKNQQIKRVVVVFFYNFISIFFLHALFHFGKFKSKILYVANTKWSTTTKASNTESINQSINQSIENNSRLLIFLLNQ